MASGAKLTVADTAANLLLAGNSTGVAEATTVQLTGTSNSITAAQATTLAGKPNFALASGAKLTVADTAVNLLDGGNATGIGKATTVQLTGTSNSITAAQAATLAGKPNFALASGATLVVADTAANLLLAGNTAGVAKATTVQLTGTSNSITAAQANTLAGKPNFALASGATLVVADTAANLLLAGNAAGVAKGTTIQLTGTSNSITAAQATTLAGQPNFALASGATLSITGTNTISAAQATLLASVSGWTLATSANIAVSDSSSNVSNNLDSIQALAAASKINAVLLTDSGTPSLSITYAQYTSDTSAIAKISGSYGLVVSGAPASAAPGLQANSHVTAFSISDTTANVLAGLDALNTDSKISSIAFTDSGTPSLSITYLRYTSDTSAIGKFTGSYGLVVSGAPASAAPGLQANSHVTAFSISDTAVNVLTGLDALNTDSKITSIAFTDSGTPSLSITYSRYTSDTAAIGKISGSYGLVVSGAPASAASGLQANSHVIAFSISDTAANVLAGLDALNTDSKISSIAFTDSGTPSLSITYAQYTNDTTAIGKFSGSNGLVVSSAPVSAAAALQANSHVSAFSVSDTAANATAGLDALNGDSKISAIAFTDSGTPSLSITYAQYTNDTAAIGKISGSYGLVVSGAPASAAPGLNSPNHVQEFSVVDAYASFSGNAEAYFKLSTFSILDSAYNISANIWALSYNTQLSSISLTDQDPLRIQSGEIGNYGALESKLPSDHTVVVSGGVSLAVAAILQQDTHVVSFSVGDQASMIAASLDTLNGDSKISAITFIDSGTPSLSITYAQYTNDTTAIGKFSGSYGLVVSSAPVSAAAALQANTHVTSFSISDTASAVQTAIDALNGDGKLIGGISLTDAGMPTLTLSYTQYSADTSVLSKLPGTYSLTVTGAPASAAAGLQSNGHVVTFSVSGTAVDLLASGNWAAVQGASSVTLTGANVISASDAATLSGLANLGLASGATLSVFDTATNIATNLDALQTLVTAGFLTSIILPPGTPSVGAGQYYDATDGVVFQYVADPGIALQTALNAAAGMTLDGATGYLATPMSQEELNFIENNVLPHGASTGNVYLGGQRVTGTTAEWQWIAGPNAGTIFWNNGPVAGEFANWDPNYALPSGSPASPARSDQPALYINGWYRPYFGSASGNALSSLGAGGNSGIVVEYSGFQTSVALPITYAQMLADGGALALLPSGYTLTVAEVPVSAAVAMQANSKVTSFSISDTAAAVQAAIDILNGDDKLSVINFTDAGTPSLTLSYGQYSADTSVLSKLPGTYSLTVTGASISAASSLQADSHVTSFSISETAANAIAGLDALNGDSKISSIAFTDSGTPSLSITYAQYTGDSAAIAKFTGSYGLVVSDAPFSAAETLQGDSHVTAFSVSDGNLSVSSSAIISPSETVTVGTLDLEANLTVAGSLSVSGVLYGSYANGARIWLDGGSVSASAILLPPSGVFASLWVLGHGQLEMSDLSRASSVSVFARDGLLKVSGDINDNMALYVGWDGTEPNTVLEINQINDNQSKANVTFFDRNASLILDQPDLFAGNISGFMQGDTLDLRNFIAHSINYQSGVLSVASAGGGQLSFGLTTGAVFPLFTFNSDGNGGTLVQLRSAAESWIGQASSDWSDSANWSLGRAPLSSDMVSVSSSAIISPSETATVGTLDLEANLTVAGSLSVSGVLYGSYANGARIWLDGGSVSASAILLPPSGVFASLWVLGHGQLEMSDLSRASSVSVFARDGLLKVSGDINDNMALYVGWDGTEPNTVLEINQINDNQSKANVTFFDRNASLILDQPDLFAGNISGFMQGDTLDLRNFIAHSINYQSGVLSVASAGGGQLSFGLTTGAVFPLFTFNSDGNGGTLVQLADSPVALSMNNAYVSPGVGLASPSISFLGSPVGISLSSAAATIQYALQPSSGIETIANFKYDLDQLNIDMLGAASSVLQAADTIVDGVKAISLYSSADPTHGVVLTGMTNGQTAANLLTSHASFSNGHAIVT